MTVEKFRDVWVRPYYLQASFLLGTLTLGGWIPVSLRVGLKLKYVALHD